MDGFSGRSAQKAAEMLKKARVRPSAVRLDVLNVFLQQNKTFTHQDLMSFLPPGTDRVTVYRTLHTLVDAGLLHTFKTQDRSVAYAIGKPGEHGHAHIQCTECGTVACLEDVVASPKEKEGWVVQEQETLLSGVCPACVDA